MCTMKYSFASATGSHYFTFNQASDLPPNCNYLFNVGLVIPAFVYVLKQVVAE